MVKIFRSVAPEGMCPKVYGEIHDREHRPEGRSRSRFIHSAVDRVDLAETLGPFLLDLLESFGCSPSHVTGNVCGAGCDGEIDAEGFHGVLVWMSIV